MTIYSKNLGGHGAVPPTPMVTGRKYRFSSRRCDPTYHQARNHGGSAPQLFVSP